MIIADTRSETSENIAGNGLCVQKNNPGQDTREQATKHDTKALTKSHEGAEGEEDQPTNHGLGHAGLD